MTPGKLRVGFLLLRGDGIAKIGILVFCAWQQAKSIEKRISDTPLPHCLW